MKALFVCGSFRENSNTNKILEKIAVSSGCDCELVYLRDMEVEPWTGCLGCMWTEGHCIIEDGMQELYDKIMNAGAIIIGSPTSYMRHGKTLIELLNRLGTYRVIGVVDDGLPAGQLVLGMPVLGGSEVLDEFYSKGVRLALNAVGGIGNLGIRINVFHKLAQSGYTCPSIAHPSAFIESSAHLAPGVQIFTHAYIGSQASIGYGAIINTGAIISHDCVLGDYVNISPAAVLAGGVQVGAGSLIGMGVTVNLQVKICNGARIGNAATIKSDVPEGGVVHAGAVWPEK